MDQLRLEFDRNGVARFDLRLSLDMDGEADRSADNTVEIGLPAQLLNRFHRNHQVGVLFALGDFEVVVLSYFW